MPNWCFTDYVIEGDPNEVADLHQKLSGLLGRTESLVENGFGKNWLGNVAELFGKSWEKVDCRGTFNDLELIDGCIYFNTETAWSDCSDLWDFVCAQYESVRHYYRAEECGCCYYATNDRNGKHFPERYLLYISNEDNYYFDELDDALKLASERLGQELKTVAEVEAAIYEHNEDDPDDWMSFSEFKVVESNQIREL